MLLNGLSTWHTNTPNTMHEVLVFYFTIFYCVRLTLYWIDYLNHVFANFMQCSTFIQCTCIKLNIDRTETKTRLWVVLLSVLVSVDASGAVAVVDDAHKSVWRRLSAAVALYALRHVIVNSSSASHDVIRMFDWQVLKSIVLRGEFVIAVERLLFGCWVE